MKIPETYKAQMIDDGEKTKLEAEIGVERRFLPATLDDMVSEAQVITKLAHALTYKLGNEGKLDSKEAQDLLAAQTITACIKEMITPICLALNRIDCDEKWTECFVACEKVMKYMLKTCEIMMLSNKEAFFRDVMDAEPELEEKLKEHIEGLFGSGLDFELVKVPKDSKLGKEMTEAIKNDKKSKGESEQIH